MSIYDKASLVLIPSGTKTSKVYSQKPVNGDGDFTFSRSTAATRVNASGLIEKETMNLLTYSNDFSNFTTITSGVTLTSGQAGYDGSNDAWKLEKNATGYQWVGQSPSISGVYTISVYGKAGTLENLVLRDGLSKRATFNLTNGTFALSGSIFAKTTDVGNGWYRCEAVFTTSSPTAQIYVDYNQTNAGYIYIQDAQLEQGLVARDYIETTTTAVEGGITDNVPRLDYTDASCPALLLEPQRTNYFRHSEYFGTSDWGTTTTTITTNTAISPNGYENATTLTPTSASTNSGITSYVVTSATAHTMSVYAKVASGTKSFKFFRYNTTDGSVSSPTFTATTTWQRFTWTTTPSVAGSSWYITNAAADTIPFDIYGAQLEEGSYATSYIPTYGSAVTRSQDLCVDAGDADTFNDSQGTLFAEVFIEEDVESNINISVSGGVHAQNLLKFIYLPTNFELRFEVYGASLDTRIQVFNFTLGVNHKIAGSYDGTNTKLYIDGVQINSISTNQIPTGLNQFNFDRADGAAPFTGKAKQVLYFPTALTNAELADLTTL